MFDAWNVIDFAPSATLGDISESITPAIAGLKAEAQQGAGSLDAVVDIVPNLAPDVAALSGMADTLRGQFSGLMAGGVSALCVHPWVQNVGERKGDYAWLTSENALQALAARAAQAPQQGNAALVLMFTSPSLDSFSSTLQALGGVFPLKTLEQAERRARSLASLETSKFIIPPAPAFPFFENLTPGTPTTGAAMEQATGEMLARIEAAKAAATSPLEALKQAGKRVQAQLTAALQKVDNLKQAMTGSNASWFGAYLTGNPTELARELSALTPPTNAAHKLAAAMLLVGDAANLAYFQETFLPMVLMRLDDYKVPGFGLRVSGAGNLKKSDASGSTSSTTKSEEGTKAKSLTVTTQIRYKDEADLRELIRVAEAKSGSEAKVYTLVNTTANAAGIRQVTFSDRITWDEQDGRACWNVQFTLTEHLSVAERTEARQTAKGVTAVQNSGDSVTATAEQAPEEQAPDDGFGVLNWIEKKLIGDYSNEKQKKADQEKSAS